MQLIHYFGIWIFLSISDSSSAEQGTPSSSHCRMMVKHPAVWYRKRYRSFKGAMSQVLGSVPEEQQTGTAYTISKNFVIWYTAKMAVKYGSKGIRVVSISPGTFKTPMGEAEGEQAASFALQGALGRMGEPIEIARMMAFMVSDECSYLTGVDVLYDGGSIAAFRDKMAQ